MNYRLGLWYLSFSRENIFTSHWDVFRKFCSKKFSLIGKTLCGGNLCSVLHQSLSPLSTRLGQKKILRRWLLNKIHIQKHYWHIEKDIRSQTWLFTNLWWFTLETMMRGRQGFLVILYCSFHGVYCRVRLCWMARMSFFYISNK